MRTGDRAGKQTDGQTNKRADRWAGSRRAWWKWRRRNERLDICIHKLTTPFAMSTDTRCMIVRGDPTWRQNQHRCGCYSMYKDSHSHSHPPTHTHTYTRTDTPTHRLLTTSWEEQHQTTWGGNRNKQSTQQKTTQLFLPPSFICPCLVLSTLYGCPDCISVKGEVHSFKYLPGDR